MEKITDPLAIRDYNGNGFIEIVGYKQPGYLGTWWADFLFVDGETGVVRFAARQNSVSFGDNAATQDKYIYAETGAVNEPYIRYNVTAQRWETYPTLSGGGPGPILTEHNLLDSTVHTDTETSAPVQGDLIVGSATPKWGRFAKGSANQILGVQPAGTTLEWKSLAAGSGIGVSLGSTITISNTGVLSLNALTGALTLQGTANQVNVSSAGSTITLSLPQNIHAGATPTFAGITLTGLTGVLFGNGSSPVTALAAGGALQYLRRNAAHTAYEWATLTASDLPAHNLLSAQHGDTVAASVVLGDLIVGNLTPRWQRLAGNTTTTKKFLTQVGTGVASALPVWDTIADGDIPSSIVRTLRQIIAGTGLSGGGDLSADRTLSWNGLTVRKNTGVDVGTRRRLNLIEGSGITLVTADDAADAEIDVTISATAQGAPVGAAYVTIGNDATLTAERALAVNATNLTLSDGGANGSVTINTIQNIDTSANVQFGTLVLLSNISAKIALKPIAASGTHDSISFKDSSGNQVGEFIAAVGNTSGNRYLACFAYSDVDGNKMPIKFFTTDSVGSLTQAIYIGAGTLQGNVAIGTIVNPSEKLHVVGNIKATGQLIVGSGPVTLTDGTGKIPALSSSYFASLDASALLRTLTVRKNSVAVGTQRQINFIESGGIQWDSSDDGTEIDLTPRVKRMIVLPVPGDPAVGSPVSIRIATQTGGTITAIKHICTTAATTTYTYDVNKNGTTIYTTQANRPTRTSSNGTTLVTATLPDVTTFVANDVFSIDLDTQGTGVKDVVFFVYYTES